MRSSLACLLERARTPSWRIWAENSPFDLKDLLKARGYRWNGEGDAAPRAWYIDVDGANKEAELTFLRREVYRGDIELLVGRIDATDRFSERCRDPAADAAGHERRGSPFPTRRAMPEAPCVRLDADPKIDARAAGVALTFGDLPMMSLIATGVGDSGDDGGLARGAETAPAAGDRLRHRRGAGQPSSAGSG
jgi:hypothetical protein